MMQFVSVWIPTPGGLRCTDCDAEFKVGEACACESDPGSGATLVSMEIDATGTGEDVEPLLTHSGRMQRLAALAVEVRDAEGHIDVKRAEAELKIVRTIASEQEKAEDVARIQAVEGKLATLEEALNQTRGFAAREDRAVIPPEQGEEHN